MSTALMTMAPGTLAQALALDVGSSLPAVPVAVTAAGVEVHVAPLAQVAVTLPQPPAVRIPVIQAPPLKLPSVQTPVVPPPVVKLPPVKPPPVKLPPVKPPPVQPPPVKLPPLKPPAAPAPPRVPAPSTPKAPSISGVSAAPTAPNSPTSDRSAATALPTGQGTPAEGAGSTSQSGDGTAPRSPASIGGAVRKAGDKRNATRSSRRRLVYTVTRLESCVPQIDLTQRRVLSLRAGLGSRPALSRAQVARRLDVGVRRVARIERRGVKRLVALAQSGSCAAASPGAAAPLVASPDPPAGTAIGASGGNAATPASGAVKGVSAHSQGDRGDSFALPSVEGPGVVTGLLLLLAALGVLAFAVRRELRRR